MSTRKKSKGNGPILFGLIVAALAVVGWGAGPGGWFRPEEQTAIEGAPVRRGSLRISEISRGNLEAKDSLKLVNELEGRATIIHLIEEGAIVEPGDLVCELDVSEMRDRRVSQEISVKNAEAGYTKAREQYDIQKIQNASDIAKAELDLELAKLELEKYVESEGEWVHELAQADEAITIAEEELKQAQETLKWTTELESKGFAQRTEVERDQLAVEKFQIKVEQATREKKLMERFEHRKRTAELEAAVATAEREVEKVEKQALAKLADFEAARDSAQFELGREKDKLTKIDDQLGKARIVATEAGMVVYARQKNGRMGGGEVPQEGTEVHERQVIATIPRAGGMIADVSLHETKFNKVREGQSCVVSVDALPGKVFHGKLVSKAPVADSGSWMSNPNQRLYKTEVSLSGVTPDMRPGMSCEVEILIAELPDVLYVPRQAVFLDGDRTVCFVNGASGAEPRPVTPGLDNSAWVEIKDGLQEGEVVLLSPPASWEPAPATRPERALPEGDDAPAPELAAEASSDAGPASAPSEASESSADGAGAMGERRGRPDGESGRGTDGGRSGFGGGRSGGGGFGNMTEEQRAEMRKRFEGMSPEERRAAFEAMRGGAGGGGGDGR